MVTDLAQRVVAVSLRARLIASLALTYVVLHVRPSTARNAAILSLALIATTATGLGILMIPEPTYPPLLNEAPIEEGFDDAWNDSLKVVALNKANMARVAIAPDPKPVVTERILPPSDTPAIVPPMIVLSPPSKRSRRHVTAPTKPTKDICARHNLRKVTVGNRWRCRK